MKLRVMGNNILIRPEKVEKKIIITPGDEELSKYAEVIAVGKFVSDIEPGERIFWSARAGTPFEFEGEDLILIDLNSVFCVLE